MARKYIHGLIDWPGFTWDAKTLAPLLSGVRLCQGLLLGKMRGYGFASQWTATLKVLKEETIKYSEIEGVALDPENVRSSLARRLGLEVGGLKVHKDRYVDGVVEMMLDATQKFKEPLTKERLFDWHGHLFPGVRTTSDKFRVGAWRDDSQGPMQVVSGPIGRHKIHYVAPMASRVESEMGKFLKWLDGSEQQDPLLKAAIAHLWFVTIHPFEDGNGRIGRAIAEMCLARSDGSAQRFYSMSSKSLEQTIQWIRREADEREMDENNKSFLAHCSSRHRRADCYWGHRTRRGRRKKHFLQAKQDCRRSGKGDVSNARAVPVWPRMRTIESDGATLLTWDSTLRRGSDEPTISSNIDAWFSSSRRAAFSRCSLSSACLRSSISVHAAYQRRTSP